MTGAVPAGNRRDSPASRVPRLLPTAFLFLLLAVEVFPAEPPRIRNLDTKDPVFVQYLSDVEDARRRLASQATAKEVIGAFTVYSYTLKAGDELIPLAARCSVPYETIASANHLDATVTLVPGKKLLLPSTPGLFIPETPTTDLERIMSASRTREAGISLQLDPSDRKSRYRFLPGAEYTPTERAFFLNAAFHFPLPYARLTSSFGYRPSPFTGKPSFHGGLDLAAPTGTEVYAARAGTVIEVSYSEVYGNYIMIEHEGGWISVYGHLSKVETDLRKRVQSGTIIGRVGTTGQSTGPHLHFELRRNGEVRDPAPLLSKRGS